MIEDPPEKTHLMDLSDPTSYRPLLWIILMMLVFWVVYFWTLPVWASWSLAICLGIGTSFVLGAEIKTAIGRRIGDNRPDQTTGGADDAS